MSVPAPPDGGRPMVLRVFRATVAAGLAVAVLDLVLLAVVTSGPGPHPGFRTVGYALGLGALGGLLAAVPATLVVAAGILAGRGRRIRFRHPGVLLVSALLVAGFVRVNRTTFGGPGIAAHPLAGLLEAVFLVAGAATIVAATRGVAAFAVWSGHSRPAHRRALGLLAVLAGTGAHAADASVLPGGYPQIHLQCAALSAALLTVGILGLGLPGWTRGWRAALVVVVPVTAAVVLRHDPGIAAVRAEIAARAPSLRQWMAFPEALLERVAKLPELPAAPVDGILARRTRDRNTAATLGLKLDGLVPGRRDLNVIVISADTLRPDHVSSAGYAARTGRRTTPNLDALAARSLVFPRCYTTYPTSAWAYSSLFSGRTAPASPFARVVADPDVVLPPDLTLPGLLRKRGVRTAAVAAFNAETAAVRKLFGHLGEGFEVFDRNRRQVAEDAAAITDDAIAELDLAGPGRFFLWVHYMDPHEPYTRHPGFDFGPAAVDRYDSELAFCDAQVGRLLAELERRGLASRTVVVAMSDHGEAFGEHCGYRHDSSLYDEQIRVLLAIAAPGLPPGSVDTVASLADVLPTLTQILAIDDPHPRSGRSLWPSAFGLAAHEGWAHAALDPEWSGTGRHLEALVHGRLKLVVDHRHRAEELFDVVADPGETRNLVGERQDEAASMRGLLAAVRAESVGLPSAGEAAPPPPPPPAARIRSGLDHLATLRPENATQGVCAATTMLRHPVHGLSPELAGELGPAERDELSQSLRALADPGNDVSTRCILTLLTRLENPRDLEFARAFRSGSLRLHVENTALRGALGDREGIPELLRLLDAPVVPKRHELAAALLALGERPPLAIPLAACQTRLPWEVSRIVRGLARIRAEELLPLAAELLDNPYWQAFGPIRTELAAGLAAYPVAPLRERLLARLAHDGEPAVVRRALDALRRDHPPDRCTRWLAVGEIEADAARSLVHGDVAGAAAALERSLVTLPDAEPEAARALARLRHFLGKADAPDTERPPPIESYLREPFPFAVEGVVVPARVLTEAWYHLELRVRNTGQVPWPGPETGAGFELRPELVTPGGRVVCGDVPMDHRLPRAGTPPGGAVEIVLPVGTPDTPGRLVLNLRLVRRFPDGAVQVDPLPTATGLTLDVFPALPVEDANLH